MSGSAIQPSGFFLLRTPLLPFDEVLKWSEGVQSSNAAASLAGDRALLRARLKQIVARPEIREALFLASPDLDESIAAWEQDPESKRGQRIERSLIRYFMRMAGRATPFGLFAGCSVGAIDAHTNLVLGRFSDYERHTRLDMDYLCALVSALEQLPAVQRNLIHHVNSLYFAGGRLRYMETRTGTEVRSYHLVAIESAPYIETALSLAKPGRYPHELAALLVDADPSFSATEAEEFVTELIESQLLISELAPAITGPEPAPALIARLHECDETTNIAERLAQTEQSLAALDAGGLGNPPERYRAIANSLSELPAEVNLQRLLQIDMIKPSPEATLGQGPVKEIIRGVNLLHRISRPPQQTALDRFRESFVERYGEGREVPLLEVLDADAGIGFSSSRVPVDENSPALRGLVFKGKADTNSTWTKRETYLLRKLTTALVDGRQEISLEPDDIEALANDGAPPLPDAFAVIASVGCASEAALKRGEFQVTVNDVHGPSGARTMGRFCHLSEELKHRVDEHIQSEESLQPDAIFAEVVHLPAGRTGNVLLRPLLRSYEIPYLGVSGAPHETQIPVNDLVVTVIGDRIELRSATLRRKVLPRLTTAHYFLEGGLDVYRFLCLLQEQGTSGSLNWDWGPLGNAPFLPRVRSERLVLSRQRWNLDEKQLRELKKPSSREHSFQLIQDFRTRLRWPRFIAVVDDDNELPLDLDNVLCVETLVELMKNADGVSLVELLPAPGEHGVRGVEGQYVHQIIVPFVQQRAVTAAEAHQPAQVSDIQRSLPLLSEWLYAKVYTGTSSGDEVLRKAVRNLVQECSGIIQQWFFVRYGDPDWHLRIRFNGPPEQLHEHVLPALNRAMNALLAEQLAWRMQIDSYQREVERYGGAEGILRAEKIFHADSEAVLAIVEAFRGNAGMEARFQLAFRGINDLMNDFGLDVSAKHALIDGMRANLAEQLAFDLNAKRALGAKYRATAEVLPALCDPNFEPNENLYAGVAAFQARSEQIRPVVNELKELERSGRLTTSPTNMLRDLIHMHVNRILRAAQPAEEFVLYDFLSRFYKSQLSRH